MQLFTETELNQLIENGTIENCRKDHKPVVKLYMPGTDCIWLINSVNPKFQCVAIGLIDLGFGNPEIGVINLYELMNIENLIGLTLEKDETFVGKYPLSAYYTAAKVCDRVTEKDALLKKCYTFKLLNPKPS